MGSVEDCNQRLISSGPTVADEHVTDRRLVCVLWFLILISQRTKLCLGLNSHCINNKQHLLERLVLLLTADEMMVVMRRH